MSTQQFVDDAVLGRLYPDHLETLKARHDRALEKAGASHAIVFSGAPKLKFLDDNYYSFQANPHFVSWLPLTATPFCYLVHTPGEKPRLIYYQEKDYWHLPPASPEGFWTAYFDIRIVNAIEDVAELLPPGKDKCILIGEIEDESHAFGIERINPNTAVNILHYARARKTPYELECMRAASRRGAAGHRAAEEAFRGGSSEFDIHLAYCRAVGQTETELPYGNIIALNDHGAVLHYQHQSPVVPENIHSFLIDAGATVYGYASDITRAYSYDSGEYQDIIERMDAMQLEIVSEVRAGVDYAALHIATHEKLAALLIDLDLANGSVDALIVNGVTSAFFPHGLGHFLGIQVHDVGGFMADESGTVIDRPSGHSFLRLTRSLEIDQVLTIEPGLYVIDMLLDNLQGTPGHAMLNQTRIDWLRPFGGIRIEDNVRVLDDGVENLTRDAIDSRTSASDD
jgi:Xaa-Pro dipeptidase